MQVPDIGDFDGGRGDRGPGGAGRHRGPRAEPDHGRVGQGVDGDSFERRRQGRPDRSSRSATRSPRAPRRAIEDGRGRRRTMPHVGCRRTPARGARRRRPRAPLPAPRAADTGRVTGAAPAAPAAQHPGRAAAGTRAARAHPVPADTARRRGRDEAACLAVGAAVRARARRRTWRRSRARGPRNGSPRTTCRGFVKGVMPSPRPRPAAARRRAAGGAALGLIPWPKVDFAKYGDDRGQAAVADQEDRGREPASQLGDDPARHQSRRCGHHRPRGVPADR